MANRIADPAQYTTKTTLGGGELLHSNDANQDRLFTVDTLSTYAGNKAIPPGYIDGLVLTWVNGTALTVTSGSAYIPSLARVLRVPSDIAKSGLSLSASTWYHVYLYINGSTPDVEIVTTPPSSPYNGVARTKNGDTSRRYLGSVLGRSASEGTGMMKFIMINNDFHWLESIGPGFLMRVLSAGSATTATVVNCSQVVPITCFRAVLNFNNTSSSSLRIDTPGANTTPPTTSMLALKGGVQCSMQFALSSNQTLQYMYTAASSGGLDIDVSGYSISR